jgi:hypothetical protein
VGVVTDRLRRPGAIERNGGHEIQKQQNQKTAAKRAHLVIVIGKIAHNL